MDIEQYKGMNALQLEGALKEAGYRVSMSSYPEDTVICREAGLFLLEGRLIRFDEIVKVFYREDNSWDDYDGDITEMADIYGHYNKWVNNPIVYEYDEHTQSTTIKIDYIRDGIEKMIQVDVDDSVPYWVNTLVDFVKKRGNEYKNNQK